MMSWHLRSVIFAGDLSANDLTREAFLTNVHFAYNTEQPLVFESCVVFTENQRPRNTKVETIRPEVFFEFCHLERCRMSNVLRARWNWTLPVWSERSKYYYIAYAILLHLTKNILPWTATNTLSGKVRGFNKMLKRSSTLERYLEIYKLTYGMDLLNLRAKSHNDWSEISWNKQRTNVIKRSRHIIRDSFISTW